MSAPTKRANGPCTCIRNPDVNGHVPDCLSLYPRQSSPGDVPAEPTPSPFDEGLEAAALLKDEDAKNHRAIAAWNPEVKQDALHMAEICEADALRFRAMKRGGK